ncbi:ribonuclease Z [Candidatus Woesearchaeota archaeon]|nr:ribonuclease Z [Candidatus Woesearchaeota archaeon]
MIDITILGTSSMVPTKERHPSAVYLEFKGEGILFDCGEGAQRQMNKASISRAKVRKIFLSHWHGDHTAGLIGLIQTIGNSNYEDELHVYGPVETMERFDHLMAATIYENKIAIKVHELKPKEDEVLTVVENDDYIVTCVRADHNCPSIAYAFTEKDRTRVDMAACKKLGITEGPQVGKLSRGEAVDANGKRVLPKDVTYQVKGKKLAYVVDTNPHENLQKIAMHSDVLICEATFNNKHEHKADEFKHMTAEWAAQLASRAEVGRLILTHFSQRYPTVQQHVEEAQAIFPATEAAYDLMRIRL